jgi:hypothetical protein
MHQVGGVVVDLPEDPLPVVLEGAEVALAIRIVALAEVAERLDLLAEIADCSAGGSALMPWVWMSFPATPMAVRHRSLRRAMS